MKKISYLMTAAALFTLSGSLFAATVVTVNGVKIDSSEVERRAKNVQVNSQGQVSDSPELRRYITNELITEQLVVQEARKLKLDKSAEYKAAEDDALKQIKAKGLDKQADFKQNWADYQNGLLMMVYAEDVLKKNPITDAAVQQHYNQIKSRYHQTSEIQLSEIVLAKASDVDVVMKALNSKKKFADVAKQYSISPTKTEGGLLNGYLALADLKESNAETYQAVGSLSKGQFTKTPIKHGEMSVILYVNDKRPINVPAFEQLKAQLKNELQEMQVSRAVDRLGSSASIVPAK